MLTEDNVQPIWFAHRFAQFIISYPDAFSIARYNIFDYEPRIKIRGYEIFVPTGLLVVDFDGRPEVPVIAKELLSRSESSRLKQSPPNEMLTEDNVQPIWFAHRFAQFIISYPDAFSIARYNIFDYEPRIKIRGYEIFIPSGPGLYHHLWLPNERERKNLQTKTKSHRDGILLTQGETRGPSLPKRPGATTSFKKDRF